MSEKLEKLLTYIDRFDTDKAHKLARGIFFDFKLTMRRHKLTDRGNYFET